MKADLNPTIVALCKASPCIYVCVIDAYLSTPHMGTMKRCVESAVYRYLSARHLRHTEDVRRVSDGNPPTPASFAENDARKVGA
jgi:hypothetical protein